MRNYSHKKKADYVALWGFIFHIYLPFSLSLSKYIYICIYMIYVFPHPLNPACCLWRFFSGHAEAMLVLESMRHDNRAEGVSVDFRRQGVKIWRTLRLLAECCCSGSCDYMVMFLYVMITIFQGIYPTNEKISEVRYIDALPILKLGGGFQHFLFSPLPGEDEPILTNIFPTGLVQPPTRKPFKTHQIHWLFGQVTIAAFWVSG